MKLTQADDASYSIVVRGGDDQDDGFSLIELLIVIVILGILAAVVVLAVGGLRADAEDSACPADFRNLITATESYFVQFDATSLPQADLTPDGYEKTLVNVGLIRAVSQWYDVDADGELLLPVGSPCTLT